MAGSDTPKQADSDELTRADFMIKLLQGWAKSRGIPEQEIVESLTGDAPFVMRPDAMVDLIWFICDANLSHKARQSQQLVASNGEVH